MLSFYELNLILEKHRQNEAIDPMDFSRYAPGHSGGRMTKKIVDPGAHLDRKLQDQGYARDRRPKDSITDTLDLPSVLREKGQHLAADILHKVLPTLNPAMQYSPAEFLTLVGGKLGHSVNPQELQKAIIALASPPEGYPAHIQMTKDGNGMPRFSVVQLGNRKDQEDILAKPGEGGRYASPMANARTTKVAELKPLTVDALASIGDKYNDRLMTLHDVQSPTFVDEAGKYIDGLRKLAGRPMDDEARQLLDQEIELWQTRLQDFQSKMPKVDYKPNTAAAKPEAPLVPQAAAKGPDASVHDKRAIEKIKADLTVERDPKKRQELLDDLIYFGGSPDDVPAVQTAAPPMPKPAIPTMGKPPVSLPPAPPTPSPTAKPMQPSAKSPLSRFIKK